jgi:hypothetical protein
MWSIRIGWNLVEEWAQKALELAPEVSEAKAQALLALANIGPDDVPDELLQRASALAEELGNPELRSYALGARSQAAFARRRFDDALGWTQRRLELLAEIEDPDHVCEGYEAAVPVAVATGRFGEAERLARLHSELTRRLSPHHQVHSQALVLERADALGDWDTIVGTTDRTLEAVARNLSTPCVRNPRSLLLCALAHLCKGDESRASELEREAASVAGQGYDAYLAAPRSRAAMLRGDRKTLEALVDLPWERTYVWGAAAFAVKLDALTVLRRNDSIEREAPLLLSPGAYVEPFALRALGIARHDDALLASADERFAALGLEWHAAQTERLLAGL